MYAVGRNEAYRLPARVRVNGKGDAQLWLNASNMQAPAVEPLLPNQVSGLKLWLDASQITGLNDGDAVATWSDVSGNGHDATQAVGGNRPIYKTNIVNGRPTVRFNGTDQWLDLLGASALNILRNVPGWTIMAVARSTVADATQRQIILFLTNTTTARGFLCANAVNSQWGFGARRLDGDSSATGNGGTVSTGTPSIAAARVDHATTTGQLFVEGSVASHSTSFLTTGNTSDTASAGARVGRHAAGDQYWSGDISELMVWPRALTTAERLGIETYLSQKYAIALTCFPVNDGDPVQVWPDLSGKGNYAIQNTSAARPLWKVAVQNGRPVVRFDGTDDILNGPMTGFSAVTDAATAFAVVQFTNATNDRRVLFEVSDSLTQTNRCFHAYMWDTSFVLRRGASGADVTVAGPPKNTFLIYSAPMTSARRQLYRDGGFLGENTTTRDMVAVPAVYQLAKWTGVAGYEFQGDYAELLIYSRALSDTERRRIERYLSRKWAITLVA